MQRNVAGFKLVSLCAIATCGVVPLAVQHCTGQSEKPVSRTWTDDAGHRIEAVFLRADAEKVYLKRTDGVEGAVPLARLSEADRQYVQRRIAAPVTISADKTVEQLVTQLEDEDCEYRIAAMEALRRMGPRAAPALPELKKALLDRITACIWRLSMRSRPSARRPRVRLTNCRNSHGIGPVRERSSHSVR
jgi:hypothetical protein